MIYSLSEKIDGQALSLKVSNSIGEISDIWSSFSLDNIYASPRYLSLLEGFGPLGYEYIYAVLLKEDRPIAVTYFQLKRIQLYRDFRVHTHSDSIFEKTKIFLLKNLFKLVNHNILVCGNVLLTGEYAFGLRDNKELDSEVISEIFEKVCSYSKKQLKKSVQTILAKDFFKAGPFKKQSFNLEGFTPTTVQPAMIMSFDESWESFEDYIASVKSKYRVKFKKVLRNTMMICMRFTSKHLKEPFLVYLH